MGLTDFAIRQAKATDRPYTLGDSDGLSLAISAQGRKSWHFRYYWQATQKRMSLGTYPEVTLREARHLRDQARALLRKGVNPRLDRKRKQQAVHLAQENSFEAIYQQWLTHRRLELQDGRQSTLAQMQRIFGKDVLPKVGRFPIHEIRRFDLLDILRKIETRGALTTAEKVRTWLNQLYRYALVVVDGLEHNPAADLDVVARPKPPVAHNPFLSLRELPEFLRTLRTYHGRTVTTQLGLRLLLLTGVRTGELRRAEPSQFRLDQGLWVIPPANVKQWQIELRRGSRRVQDIAEANRLPYGLSAYAFTTNARTAVDVGDRLAAGMIGINQYRIVATELPFGGIKESGHGSEGGREGIAYYLTTKFISQA
jgi:hypothetical protein